MNYATRAQLEKYGIAPEIIADISNDDIDDMIEAASRVADSYLQIKYELPLSAVGLDVTIAVCEICSYKILTAFKLFAPQTNDFAVWQDRYNNAIRWFEGITTGKVTPTGVTSADSTLDGLVIISSDESPRGW